MTLGDVLIHISKTKEILYKKVSIKISASEIKPNGRINNYMKSSFLKDANELKEQVSTLNSVEMEINRNMSIHNLSINSLADNDLVNTIIELSMNV